MVAVPIAATVEEVPFLDAKLMKLVDDYLSADDERQRLESPRPTTAGHFL